MMNLNRRQFVGSMASLGAGSLIAGFPSIVLGAAKARVVIVGGGFGGATVAKYLRMSAPDVEVTLIERNPKYVACPFSNEVLSGERELASLTYDYKAHTARGTNVIHDEVTRIDPVKKIVDTKGGKHIAYDRLVVAPGIAFDWAVTEGATPDLEKTMPHAWKAGENTLLLRKQLEAMKDGGVAIVTVPRRPYRCPPGPYERAAQMALYFKHHKPRSKVIILDDGETIAKQALFEEAWAKLYPGMITWMSGKNGGKILRIDQKKRVLDTELGDQTGDVISFIPAQKAGDIAVATGLTDKSGWCPVDATTLESTIHKSIHVIGDASSAGAMPKSANSAVSQARVVADAIVAAISGKSAPMPYYTNTCYSLVAPDYGFSIVGIYQPEGGKIAAVMGGGGLSPTRAPAYVRKAEAEYGYSWLKNVTAEAFL